MFLMEIRNKKIYLGLTFFTFFVFLLLPALSFAQNTTSYQLLAPLPEFGGTFTPGQNFGAYVQRIIYLSIIVAALLAFANIVWGGVRYMTGEALDTKELGKEQIKRSVFGLLILCASFLILQTINPYILDFRLDIQAPAQNITVTGPTATQIGFGGSGTATTPARAVRAEENAVYRISNNEQEVSLTASCQQRHPDGNASLKISIIRGGGREAACTYDLGK